MALFCSRDLFAALNGIDFPATKDDLRNYAETKDAPEAVVVMLNQLGDKSVFHDIGEVCENARIACNLEVMHALRDATFPATRDDVILLAKARQVSPAALHALEALPRSYTFQNLDEMCEYIL